MSQRNAVQFTGRGQKNAGSMAGRLQPAETTLGIGKPDTIGISEKMSIDKLAA